MTKEEFFAQLNEIDPADVKAMEKAADRQARLAKPPGSLGVLEELSIRYRFRASFLTSSGFRVIPRRFDCPR